MKKSKSYRTNARQRVFLLENHEVLQPADLGFLHPAANSLSSHSLLPVTCLSRVNTLLNQQERSASGHRHNYFHNFPHFSLGNFVIRNGGSSSKRLQSSSSSSSGSSNRHRHQSAANQALIGSGGRIIDTSSLDVLSWVAGRANSIMVESAGNSDSGSSDQMTRSNSGGSGGSGGSGSGSGGEGNHGSDRSNSPSSQTAAPRRSNSFKEVHPKFRKHTANEYLAQADAVRAHKFSRQSSAYGSSSPPHSSSHTSLSPTTTTTESTAVASRLSSGSTAISPPPAALSGLTASELASQHIAAAASLAAMIAANQRRHQLLESAGEPMDADESSGGSNSYDAPLDFSMKRRSKSPPPPYNKYATPNPLRQHSPPTGTVLRQHESGSPPTTAGLNTAPLLFAMKSLPPPSYPYLSLNGASVAAAEPPPPAYPHKVPAARPPPPTYEAAIASKPTSPTSLVSGAPSGLQRISAAANGGNSAFLNLTPRSSGNSVQFSRTSPPAPISFGSGGGSRTSPSPTAAVVKPEPERAAGSIRFKKDLENKENEREIRKITIVEENPVGSLEEHFRKSLGDEYSKWFHQGGGGVPPPVPSPGDMEIDVGTEKRRSTDSVREGGGVVPRIKGEKLGEEEVLKAFKDDQDMSGYTVEDHFAKALGDTWTKLQEKGDQKSSKPTIKQELVA